VRFEGCRKLECGVDSTRCEPLEGSACPYVVMIIRYSMKRIWKDVEYCLKLLRAFCWIGFWDYPFVTSSYTFTNGVHAGSGFNAKELGDIIGVSKAYTTRVGNGAFLRKFLERPQIISENKEQSLERHRKAT